MKSLKQRKSLRHKNWDYSDEGFYFVTICTRFKEEVFGEIVDGEMVLNGLGEVCKKEILETEKIRKEIKIDSFVVMPNHLHLIIVIEASETNKCNSDPCSERRPAFTTGGKKLVSDDKTKNKLSNTVQGLKSSITKQINKQFSSDTFNFTWQKSFHDRIIRNEKELFNIRKYILENPQKWDLDEENPKNYKI